MEWVLKIWSALKNFFTPSPGSNSVNFSNGGNVQNVNIKYDQRVYYNQKHSSSHQVVDQDQDFEGKKAQADYAMSLILFPTVSFVAFFLFLSGYIPWNSTWKIPLIVIGCAIFFNKIRYRTDYFVNRCTVAFSKLTILNTFLLSQFRIDITRKDHFPKIKSLVMFGLFTITLILLIIAMFSILINFPPSIKFPPGIN